MTMASPRSLSGVLPSRSAIVVTAGGLAVFLVVASFLLTWYPVNSPSQGYFRPQNGDDVVGIKEPSSSHVLFSKNSTVAVGIDSEEISPEICSGETAPSDASVMVVHEVERESTSGKELSSDGRNEGGMTDGLVPHYSTRGMEVGKDVSSGFKNTTEKADSEIRNEELAPSDVVTPVPSSSELKIENGKPKSIELYLHYLSWGFHDSIYLLA